MRRNLLHIWYKELSYEIREVVNVAKKVEEFWIKIHWENIWDPVEKWEKIPTWMKQIITKELNNNKVYWYSPSKWLLETREYIASKTAKLKPDDIIFFNWLWEAINKTYGYLSFSARVIWPNPAYPTHSSAEATNSWSEHLTYNLDPKKWWNPDLEDLENKVKYNPNIAGILVINPDNPTWNVFDKKILQNIVYIAKKYDLFLIFDEIYEKLVFNKKDRVLLSEIIWNVPWIAMRGISKDLPWPGARCGWMEIYNSDKDKNFRKYIDSIYRSKMLEVCSTTLPQKVLPEIYENNNFDLYLEKRIDKYRSRADMAEKILWNIDEIFFIKPKWAYYMSIVFNLDNINNKYTPTITDNKLNDYIVTSLEKNHRFDKKFCYYLLAITWICSVPLSWFNSSYDGFRMTLLEEDEKTFIQILETIKDFIHKYKK